MDTRHRWFSPALLERACARGWALPSRLRVRFERAFGAELSGVRLHEHPLVARLGAEALCWGEQILFAPGALELDSARGTRILAHELVHVLQQRAGRAPHGHGGTGLLVDGALEAEAEALAARALSGERAHLTAPGTGGGRWASPTPALQAYHVIPNAQFVAQDVNLHNATFETQRDGLRPHPHPKTHADSFLIDAGSANVMVRAHNQVALRFSDDNELAIEDTDPHHEQAKYFFATDSAIGRCNRALKSVGSSYRIAKVPGPRYLEIGPPAQPGCLPFLNGPGPKRLFQVAMSENGQLEPAVSQNCNEISGKVMGEQQDSHRTAKFKQSGNQLFLNLPRWQLGGWAPAYAAHGDIPFRLAVLITTFLFHGQGEGPNAAAARQRAVNDYQVGLQNALAGANTPNAQMAALLGYCGPIGRNYGRLVNRVRAHAAMTLNAVTLNSATLGTRYEQLLFRLGLNAYADSRVGDAFQTYSVGGMERYQDAQHRNWMRMRDEVAPRPPGPVPPPVYCEPVWEYHWGGVVAESGADRITFENYARNYEDRDGPQLHGSESRSFFQMTRVPTQINDPLIAQSWHESCYAHGFANALTMTVSKISRCGR
ncbi:DUF4157 domain-containing protein [Corallococcus praedator]|uniref:DUF4157 domain-containing protein n=1 Tax=Corallococcus praedator TaxID=2316724 RepID=A0ABX9QA14_9BACT|nr:MULTISPECIES: DUF4157 domain-containing protein [Corallococcus]RKH30272.1 DUF4157 domain-containing protein [Corallococcus sp. CA031C]RKH97824.1 DUF4157 domain-containing protein [Corallococcus praedator]